MNDIARLILHWAATNLDYMVGAAFLLSILSLVFPLIEVRRQNKEVIQVRQRYEDTTLKAVEHEFLALDEAQSKLFPRVETPQIITPTESVEYMLFPPAETLQITATELLTKLARQNLIIDDITLAALSGTDIAVLLRRRLEAQSKQGARRAALAQMSQEKELEQGKKQDDITRALVGGGQVLA